MHQDCFSCKVWLIWDKLWVMSKLFKIFFPLLILSLFCFLLISQPKKVSAEKSCTIDGLQRNGKITLVNDNITRLRNLSPSADFEFKTDELASNYLRGKTIFIETGGGRVNGDPSFSASQEIIGSDFSFHIDTSIPKYEKFLSSGIHELTIWEVGREHSYCQISYFVTIKDNPMEGPKLNEIVLEPPTVTNTVNMTVIPDPALQSDTLTFPISGKGFGVFTFYILTKDQILTSSTPKVTFSADSSGCRTITKHIVFKDTSEQCNIINKEEQTWSIVLIRSPLQVNSEYEATIINADQSVLATLSSSIGVPPPDILKVTITPEGPFKNNKNNNIVINWEGGTPRARFRIKTNLPSQEYLPDIQMCDSYPCSRGAIIPIAAPEGEIVFTVIDESNSSIQGSATVSVEAEIAPDIKAAAEVEQPIIVVSTGGGIPCNTKSGREKTRTETIDPTSVNAKEDRIYYDGILTAIGCVPTQPKAFVEGVLKFVTFFSGGLALLLMILGALQMITAEGNPENINAAREKFYSAIIGLLFIVFAVLLLQVIGVDILGLPGFTR